MPRRLTPGRLALAGVVALVIAVLLLLRTSSDRFLLIPDEAHPLAGLVRVPGGSVRRDGGGIYYVDVLQKRASLLERFFPGIHDGASLVPEHDVSPEGLSDRERLILDRREMLLSQQVASAVAQRELGYRVVMRPNGVRVAFVFPDSGAARRLARTDVIVAIGRTRIRTISDLRRALARRRVGDKVSVRVRRGNGLHRARVELSPAPDDRDRAILGIYPEQALQIRAPLRVGFDLRNVGGPSAGLAFALEVVQEKGRDIDRGYDVAATGAIEPDGAVRSVGGIQQKTFGARESGIDVFLVPAGDNAREARRYAEGMRVVPVKSFQQALRALATLPKRG